MKEPESHTLCQVALNLLHWRIGKLREGEAPTRELMQALYEADTFALAALHAEAPSFDFETITLIYESLNHQLVDNPALCFELRQP